MPPPRGPKEVYQQFEQAYQITCGPEGVYHAQRDSLCHAGLKLIINITADETEEQADCLIRESHSESTDGPPVNSGLGVDVVYSLTHSIVSTNTRKAIEQFLIAGTSSA